MKLLDLFTLLSYIALNLDIYLQARKVWQVRSSLDVSLAGLVIRAFAIVIILVKFLTIHDSALIFGQSLIAITFAFYLYLAVRYLPKPKRRR